MTRLLQILFLCFISIPFFARAERLSSYPYISGDTFREYCDYIVDEEKLPFDPSNVKEGNTIFVKTDYLDLFFKIFHPQIRSPYILVTHNSDLPIPGPYAKYLKDPKIIVWFGQNVEQKIKKLCPIPIGFANRYWEHGDMGVLTEMHQKKGQMEKTFLLYLNFQANNCPQERQRVYQLFNSKKYCTTRKQTDFKSFLFDLGQSKFVLSPRGNGADCHRTWEALHMGAIPIVKESTLDPLYTNLPVLIVKDWDKIDEKYLNRQWAKMSVKKYNKDKLYADYWFKLIDSVKPKHN